MLLVWTMLKTSYLLLSLLYLHCSICPSLEVPNGVLCPVENGAAGCACRTEAGIINLEPLSSKDGSPRFTGLSDPNSFLYDFNPCQVFTSQEECSNVYICQTASFDGTKFAIASQGDEGIYIDGTTTYLYYTGPGGREVKVTLVCDEGREDPVVTTTGDSQSFLVYEFTLISKYACPSASGARGGGGGSKAGVVGIVLVLLYAAL